MHFACFLFFFPYIQGKMKHCDLYTHASFCQIFELTRDELLQFAILAGCDYCQTIKMVGPVCALQAIKEHKTIRSFVGSWTPKEHKKYIVPYESNDVYFEHVYKALKLLS